MAKERFCHRTFNSPYQWKRRHFGTFHAISPLDIAKADPTATNTILKLSHNGFETWTPSEFFETPSHFISASVYCQSSSLWLNPCIVAAPYRNVPEYNKTGQLPNVENEGYRQHQLYEQHQQQQQQQQQRQLRHGAQQSLSHLHHGSQQFFEQQQQQQSDLLSSPVAHLGSQSPFGGPQQISFDASLQQPLMINVESMHNLNLHNIASYQQSQHHLIQQPQHHHHHQLPESSKPPLMSRSGESDDNSNVPSVVGQPGMPPPAPRPRGPKLKFTPEDDALLIDLKENKALSWKQIAEFFPGRSSGTLQVRYCTKLKAKETLWTDDSVQKLRTALQDYENEKWRIVAMKVGTGFSPAACREKAEEL